MLVRSAMLLLTLFLVYPLACYGFTQNNLVGEIDERTTSGHQDNEGLSLFREALQAAGMLDSVMGNSTHLFTVFAPNNGAIRASPLFSMYMLGLDGESAYPRWHYHLIGALNQHIVPRPLTVDDIFGNKQVSKLESELDPILINQFGQTIQNAGIVEPDVYATNGVLHVIDKVIQPKFFLQPFKELELQPEFGPDHLDRVALTDVADFVGDREVLNVVRPEGTTFVGCRIRAFNRLEEYLRQTINGEANVKFGEFLNQNFTEETSFNFLEYSQIPGNYYRPDIPNGFSELVTPYPDCGHMWITKSKDTGLCFNNGCVVETPDPREFLASNGAGYVVDKCQVCPGISMLTDTASNFVKEFNMKDIAQFLRASEWNRRHLGLSIGDGGNVTLFASMNTGFTFYNREDMTRLSTDRWKRHLWDLLKHQIIQGAWTYEDLERQYQERGPYELTALTNQKYKVDYDAAVSEITIDGGKIVKRNIRGVDGYVHFTTKVPLPISVTHSIYEIAEEQEKFKTQITYIDSVELQGEMKRLIPLTALYVPNPVWEGVPAPMGAIGEQILKSYMFDDLLWCDKLVESVGQRMRSTNGYLWDITVNDAEMPCFTIAAGQFQDQPPPPGRACVTSCDTLARNGIVHEIDYMMLVEEPERVVDSVFGAPSPSVGFQPSPPTTWQRPVAAPIAVPTTKAPTTSAQNTISTVFALLMVVMVMLN